MNRQLFLLLLFLHLPACRSKPEKITFGKASATQSALAEHSKEFNIPEVLTVTEGVHVAVGFGLANSVLIEGKGGNIIVDCMESDGAAAKVKAAFEKISSQPVKAIIYTHNHADHIFGAGVMAGEDQPDIYAHELTNYYIDRLLNVVRPIIGLRSYRMFGVRLDAESRVNCGIGPFLDSDDETERSVLRPTITFKEELETEIAGVKIKLVHAPGETADQLLVWLPEKKVLLPGDNIYKTFPNLYTIRGTPYRDVGEWTVSLDKMRALQPDYLVPSHTRPLIGADTIQSVLTDYRDGVQFVHDQTIRYINKGLSPDEIVEMVRLPPHLSRSPYLQEFYGRVDWSVKNIFNGYLGFFDGKASSLIPTPPKEKALKMAELAGGASNLLVAAETALEKQDFQWALELTDYLIRLSPEENKAQEIRYQSLIGLGERQSNPNARNYYLSQALELKGQNMEPQIIMTPSLIRAAKLEAIFKSMATRLMAEKSWDYDKKAVFYFRDVEETWSVHIRKGVAEVQAFALANPDLIIETTSLVWKELAAKKRKPLVAIAKGDLKIQGGLGLFKEFMGMFDAS